MNSCLFFEVNENEKLKNFDFNDFNNDVHIIIKSCGRFFDTKKLNEVFKPISSLSDRINERSKNFSSNTIGVHIRRGDNLISAENSSDNSFELKMKDEISLNSNTNFT